MTKLLILLFVLGFSANGADLNRKELRGEKAQSLLQALYQSGLGIVENEEGFSLLDSASVFCKVSGEMRESGGLLQGRPKCFKKVEETRGFSFDQELSNTVNLMNVLSDIGGDADGAMGSFYLSAEQINCSYKSQTRDYECSFYTVY